MTFYQSKMEQPDLQTPSISNPEDWEEFLDNVIMMAGHIQEVRNKSLDEVSLDFALLMEMLRRQGIGEQIVDWLEDHDSEIRSGLVEQARKRLQEVTGRDTHDLPPSLN